MNKRTDKILSLAAALLLAGGIVVATGGPAHATLTACDASIADDVQPTDDCTLSDLANDNLADVNTEGFFGFSDWLFGGKEEAPADGEPANPWDHVDGVPDIGLTITDSGTTQLAGTWTIDDVWGTYSDIMLIFKDGKYQGKDLPLVAYLITTTNTTGTWVSPFHDPIIGENVLGNTIKGVSHVSVYMREGENDVPEPGTLAIFGAGLIVLATARRRRKAAA